MSSLSLSTSKRFVAALLLAAGWHPAAAAQPLEAVPDAAQSPGRPGVFRLDGTDPGLRQDDLKALSQIIGRAPVVALGESIHTSGGFYEMKHRIIRYLVERERFRVVAFESPWIGVQALARYTDSCAGSPEQAVDEGLFAVFASTETRDLAQWLCEWNRSHPRDPVKVVGFDTQLESEPHVAALTAFLGRLGHASDGPIATNLRTCHFEPVRGRTTPEEVYQPCNEGLRAVEQMFDRDARQITRQTNRWDFGWARIHLASLRAWSDQLHEDPNTSDARDYGMAYVFQAMRQLAFPRAKAVIWAHNFHIARDGKAASEVEPMGFHLSRWLGRNYVSVALAAAEVEIDWPAFGCGPNLYHTFPGSAERRLRDVGEPYLLVDMTPPNRAYFFDRSLQYTMARIPTYPHQDFDAIVYLDRSPRMTPLAYESACQ